MSTPFRKNAGHGWMSRIAGVFAPVTTGLADLFRTSPRPHSSYAKNAAYRNSNAQIRYALAREQLLEQARAELGPQASIHAVHRRATDLEYQRGKHLYDTVRLAGDPIEQPPDPSADLNPQLQHGASSGSVLDKQPIPGREPLWRFQRKDPQFEHEQVREEPRTPGPEVPSGPVQASAERLDTQAGHTEQAQNSAGPDPAARIPDRFRSLEDVFENGYCHSLALQLHQSTGWPLVGVRRSDGLEDHFLVRRPDGLLIDVQGARTDEAVLTHWGLDPAGNPHEIADVTPDRITELVQRDRLENPEDVHNLAQDTANALLAGPGHQQPESTLRDAEQDAQQIREEFFDREQYARHLYREDRNLPWSNAWDQADAGMWADSPEQPQAPYGRKEDERRKYRTVVKNSYVLAWELGYDRIDAFEIARDGVGLSLDDFDDIRLEVEAGLPKTPLPDKALDTVARHDLVEDYESTFAAMEDAREIADGITRDIHLIRKRGEEPNQDQLDYAERVTGEADGLTRLVADLRHSIETGEPTQTERLQHQLNTGGAGPSLTAGDLETSRSSENVPAEATAAGEPGDGSTSGQGWSMRDSFAEQLAVHGLEAPDEADMVELMTMVTSEKERVRDAVAQLPGGQVTDAELEQVGVTRDQYEHAFGGRVPSRTEIQATGNEGPVAGAEDPEVAAALARDAELDDVEARLNQLPFGSISDADLERVGVTKDQFRRAADRAKHNETDPVQESVNQIANGLTVAEAQAISARAKELEAHMRGCNLPVEHCRTCGPEESDLAADWWIYDVNAAKRRLAREDQGRGDDAASNEQAREAENERDREDQERSLPFGQTADPEPPGHERDPEAEQDFASQEVWPPDARESELPEPDGPDPWRPEPAESADRGPGADKQQREQEPEPTSQQEPDQNQERASRTEQALARMDRALSETDRQVREERQADQSSAEHFEPAREYGVDRDAAGPEQQADEPGCEA